jgi:tRNA pseudouridine32 synthase/23S rRNA pseudouridine746 synthase/23S rRNA pseudouridine1911/1915/1917 synthase
MNKKVPKKYQPRGYKILHEDPDLIVGNKAAGVLSVAANFDRINTVHNILNQYVRKGNPKSRKCVYVVHRLDQATTGVLIFAKTEHVQQFLKNNWQDNQKIYYCIVHGKPKKESGLIESYLEEDEDYFMHSKKNSSEGKLARTEYTVLKEQDGFSLIKINLLTGRKNQIRVHMAELGTPIVGDSKYGRPSRFKDLYLHAYSISFTHPFRGDRKTFKADVPEYFKKLIPYNY